MGGKVLELESERLKKEGESLLGSLITMLLSAGRNSDVALAAKDEEVRKKFYKEFEPSVEEAFDKRFLLFTTLNGEYFLVLGIKSFS